jgi:hypothetical protein
VLAIGDAALTGAMVSGAIACGCVLWLMDRGAIGKIREILSAMIATGIGVYRSLRGERFQTWNPPESARVMATVAGE